MLAVSDAYLRAVVADSRDMPYRVTLAGSTVLDRTKIPNMTLNESMSGSSGLSLGTANSAELTLTLREPMLTNYDGMLVEPESGIVLPDGSIEWVPLGKFWVTKTETSNDYRTVKLTCADGMYHLSGNYISDLTYPATIQAVMNEIVAKTGVDFVEPEVWPKVIIRVNPSNISFRNAVGYLAGCCGSNARFNREGRLEFVWYKDTGMTIGRKTQYLDGMVKLSDKPLRVDFEVTGAKEKYNVTIITDDNGGVTATPQENILEGDMVTLAVRPAPQYELASISAVTATGIPVELVSDSEGSGYTFIQPDSNVTVTASFRANTDGPFELTVRSYEHGSIRYNASANEEGAKYFYAGDTVTIITTPDNGYETDQFITAPAGIEFTKVGEITGGTVYQFTMPQSDVTISAYFRELAIYNINRSVNTEGFDSTPGYIVIENVTTPGSVYKAGDVINVTFARAIGYAFDRYESNVNMVQVDNDEFRFTMPEYDVTITAYFKLSEDTSKTGMYSWLRMPPEPPTAKKHWAVLYKDDWDVPACQKFWLVWFDSWSVASMDSVYGRTVYRIKFDGYYYCGSQNTGHLPHAWDDSSWSGNGASGATVTWDVTVDYPWSGGSQYGPVGDYCLLASNAHLFHNGIMIFEQCENAIQFPQVGYVENGMDVREKRSLTYWKCPDTVSTPMPASNWMIVEAGGGLCMTPYEDGGYSSIDNCDGLYVLFFDYIAIENIGAVYDNTEEEFYTATVTNGHYCALVANSASWGKIRDVADGDVIGLRAPLNGCREAHDALGKYYFSGILASTVDLHSSGNLLMYANSCRACDCAPAVRKFSLRAGSNAEPVTLTYTNPLIYEKMVPAISEVVQGVTYTPAKIKHRGNPAFLVGDIVTVPDGDGVDHTILIMQQTLTFGGGMNSVIACPGQTNSTATFQSVGPLTTQVKQAVAQAGADFERRMSTNNSIVYSSLYQAMENTKTSLIKQFNSQLDSLRENFMAELRAISSAGSGGAAVYIQRNEPATAQIGALWYDPDDNAGSLIYVQADEPAGQQVGTLWYDTDDEGGASMYVQLDEPENAQVGALWFDEDDDGG